MLRCPYDLKKKVYYPFVAMKTLPSMSLRFYTLSFVCKRYTLVKRCHFIFKSVRVKVVDIKIVAKNIRSLEHYYQNYCFK